MEIEKPNPIIVADTGWAKTLPDWIYKEIQGERLINGMVELLGKGKQDYKNSVSDCECLAYLITASNRAPMGSDFTNITCYLTYKVMIQKKRITKDLIPEEFKEDYKKGLSDYENKLLDDLKQNIFRSRGGKIKHPILGFLKEFQKETKNVKTSK